MVKPCQALLIMPEKGLFGELIIPTITRCGQAIEEMSQDLQRYISANQSHTSSQH